MLFKETKMIRFFLILLLLVPSVAGAADSVGYWGAAPNQFAAANNLSGQYTPWPWTGKIKLIRASISSNCSSSCPKGRAGLYTVDSTVSNKAYLTLVASTPQITIVSDNTPPCWNTFTFTDSVSVTSGQRYYMCVNFSHISAKAEYLLSRLGGGDNTADSALDEFGHTYFSMPSSEQISSPFVKDVAIYAVGNQAPPATAGQVIIIGAVPDETQFGGATQEHPLLMARSYAVVRAAVEAFIRETFCGGLY